MRIPRMFRKKRLAIYGGSFDPPTKAHVELVKKVLRLKLVDEVIVCPSYMHREKGDQSESFLHRLAMCTMAFSAVKGAVVSADDYSSYQSTMTHGGEGAGSTYNLVRKVIRDGYGVPCDSYLLIGADCFKNIGSWYDSQYLLKLCKLIVVGRGGVSWNAMEDNFLRSKRATFVDYDSAVSSTDFRTGYREYHLSGELSMTVDRELYKTSILGMLPKDVSRYIEKEGLYKDGHSAS